MKRFNTASGKYYCNKISPSQTQYKGSNVSIPQAVSTIAMSIIFMSKDNICICFNTASGKYYCNHVDAFGQMLWPVLPFQYRKR